MDRNEQIPQPLRALVNSFSPAVKPMRHVACPICFGDGVVEMYAPDDYLNHTHAERCCYCAGKGHVVTDGDTTETA